jgi:hypothetical protein
MTQTLLFKISELINWNLFDIWCLGFGALEWSHAKASTDSLHP